MVKVTIIDSAVANLKSVCRAFESCGAEVTVTADPDIIQSASHCVLPGVGAYGNAMQSLHQDGLVNVIRDYAKSGKPLLGICVGMQILFDKGDEFNVNNGLGLIPGKVSKIRCTNIAKQNVAPKIPHIGWNQLQTESEAAWKETLLAQNSPGDYVYFVHSFQAYPDDKANILAYTTYGGHQIPAIVQKDNVYGTQFHPEKSGPVGLKMLKGFLSTTQTTPMQS